MDLQVLLDSLKNCPCGKEHTFDTKVVEIYSGLTADAGKSIDFAAPHISHLINRCFRPKQAFR